MNGSDAGPCTEFKHWEPGGFRRYAPTPPMEPLFTPEQLAEIKAYHLPGYIQSAVSPFVYLGVLLLILGVLVRPFYRWARAGADGLERRLALLRTAPVLRVFLQAMDRLWGEPGWGAALLFALLVDFFIELVHAPANIYFGYVLEHQYGMSTYTPLGYALDELKDVGVESLASAMLSRRTAVRSSRAATARSIASPDPSIALRVATA